MSAVCLNHRIVEGSTIAQGYIDTIPTAEVYITTGVRGRTRLRQRKAVHGGSTANRYFALDDRLTATTLGSRCSHTHIGTADGDILVHR